MREFASARGSHDSSDSLVCKLCAASGGGYELEDHFLSRFRDAYLAEVVDFVDTILSDRTPRVTGEDGLRAVEIAVAAEKSFRAGAPCVV